MYNEKFDLENVRHKYQRLLFINGFERNKTNGFIDIIIENLKNETWVYSFLDWYFLTFLKNDILTMDYENIKDLNFITQDDRKIINDIDVKGIIGKHCYNSISLLYKEKSIFLLDKILLSDIVKQIDKDQGDNIKKDVKELVQQKKSILKKKILFQNELFKIISYKDNVDIFTTYIEYMQKKHLFNFKYYQDIFKKLYPDNIYLMIFNNNRFAFFWIDKKVIYFLHENMFKGDIEGDILLLNHTEKLQERFCYIYKNIILQINDSWTNEELYFYKMDRELEDRNIFIKKEMMLFLKSNNRIKTDCIFCNNGESTKSHFISRHCLDQHQQKNTEQKNTEQKNTEQKNTVKFFWLKKSLFYTDLEKIINDEEKMKKILFHFFTPKVITFKGFCDKHEKFFNSQKYNIDIVDKIEINQIICDKMFFRNVGMLYNDFICHLYFCLFKKYCQDAFFDEDIQSFEKKILLKNRLLKNKLKYILLKDILLKDILKDKLLKDRLKDRLLKDKLSKKILLKDRLLKDRLKDKLLKDKLLKDKLSKKILLEDKLLEYKPLEDRLLEYNLLKDKLYDKLYVSNKNNIYSNINKLHIFFVEIKKYFDKNIKYYQKKHNNHKKNPFLYQNTLSEYLFDVNICKKLYNIFPENNINNNLKLKNMKHRVFETNKKLPFSCIGFYLIQYSFDNELIYSYNKNMFHYIDNKELFDYIYDKNNNIVDIVYKRNNIKEIPIKTKQKFKNLENNLDINNAISISIQIVQNKSIVMFSYCEDFVDKEVVEKFLKSFKETDKQISKLFIFCSIFFENLLIEKTFLDKISSNQEYKRILKELFSLDVKTPSKSKKINFCIYNKAVNMFDKYFSNITLKEVTIDDNF